MFGDNFIPEIDEAAETFADTFRPNYKEPQNIYNFKLQVAKSWAMCFF